jgi:hypothetical protein
MEETDADAFVYPLCTMCVHKSLSAATCTAFPNGIPEMFLTGESAHTTPHPGDNGILFEPAPGTEHLTFGRQATKVSDLIVQMDADKSLDDDVTKWNREFTRRRYSESVDDLEMEYRTLERRVALSARSGDTPRRRIRRLPAWKS